MMKMTKEDVERFGIYLASEEKSQNTIEKYVRDVTSFMNWLQGRELNKTAALEYKKYIYERYAPASVNAAISSLNSFFSFVQRHDMHIKLLKIQRRIFLSEEKELTKEEYGRLLTAAKCRKNKRLYYLMQTICSTGIRVSELRYITSEAVKNGQAVIRCKGKTRTVFLPNKLCKMLKEYGKKQGIQSGSLFVSKNGKPLDRSYIWKMLKSLCASAGVSAAKVFPHNFRHLFARTFYSLKKDIVRLADVLGHSNIETTRIYTVETGDICRRQIQELGLLRC